MTGPSPEPRPPRTAPPDGRPTHRRSPARAALAGLALALGVLAGCRSKDGGGAPVGASPPRDPLVHGPGRIPPQNVPVPDRDGVGAKGRDPLLTPTGRSGDKTGASYTDDPERWKGPFVPSDRTTPAALAGMPRDDGEGLRIDAAGAPLQPAGGFAPAADGAAVPPAVTRQLEGFGLKPGQSWLTRDDRGGYVFRVRVPISGNGALREYTGTGSTPAAAAQQALDSVRSERQ